MTEAQIATTWPACITTVCTARTLLGEDWWAPCQPSEAEVSPEVCLHGLVSRSSECMPSLAWTFREMNSQNACRAFDSHLHE